MCKRIPMRLLLGTLSLPHLSLYSFLIRFKSVGFAVGVWNNDSTAIHAMRDALGKKIEGTRKDFPYLAQSPSRAYADYYIDFQVAFFYLF
jgi:hypothetical protein